MMRMTALRGSNIIFYFHFWAVAVHEILFNCDSLSLSLSLSLFSLSGAATYLSARIKYSNPVIARAQRGRSHATRPRARP